MPYTDTRNLKRSVEELIAYQPSAELTVSDAVSDILKPIYVDYAFSRTLANPLRSEESGRFPMFYLPDGDYRVVVRAESGEKLFDSDQVLIRSEGGSDIAFGFARTEALLNDLAFSYANTQGWELISEGETLHVYETGISYRVLAPTATSAHVATAGGVKLAVLPGTAGYDIRGFAPAGAAAYQAVIDALPEGATLHHPEDWSLNLTDGIVIGKRLRLTGRGLLNFTAGIAQKAGLSCTADGCEFLGLRLANPNALQAPTGERNYGIEVKADEVLIRDCEVEGFQNGIAVRASGEFHNIRIFDNRVKDCIGAGQGAASTSSQGEDRGDGIVVWGAQAIIRGNVVNARADADCRVGIHVEALGGFAGTPAPHDNAMVTITDNLVYGPFRRGIVNEGCEACVITGNTVADATWWGIALVEGARQSVAANNTVIWTNPHEIWSSWSRTAAPLKFMQLADDCVFSGNHVVLKPGSVCHAILDAENNSPSTIQTDCAFRNNHAVAEDATARVVTAAVRVSEFGGGVARRPVISGNVLKSFAPTGVLLEQCIEPEVRGNRIISLAAAPVGGQYGIFLNDGATLNVTLDDNHIAGWDQAIRLPSLTGGVARDNVIADCITGIWSGASLSQFTITGNRFRSVTGTRISGANTAMRPWIRNNEGQLVYAEIPYNPPPLAPGASDVTLLSVPGAAINDFVAVAREANLAGVQLTAYVSAANQVALVHFNPGATTIDLVSADYRLIVSRIGTYI